MRLSKNQKKPITISLLNLKALASDHPQGVQMDS